MRISDWSSDVCSSDLNIAAHEAKGIWLISTDIDHVLTAENADALLKRMHRLDPETAYMLHRVEADTGLPTVNSNGQPKPHPNSFVMTRDMYWRLGGYDARSEEHTSELQSIMRNTNDV